MAEIKLIASDLDGTLLTSKKELTERAYNLLEKLSEKGIYFVPSTGRAYESVPECIRNLPFIKYVITSNGAAIYDAEEKKFIKNNFLPPEAVDITLEILKEKNVIIETFKEGRAFTDRKVYENLSDYGITGGHAKYVLTTRNPVENIIEEIINNKHCLENINLIFNNEEVRMEVMEKLKEKGHASVTTSAHNNIEVTSHNATKASALKELCSILNIERENVIAFGDSDNDMDMIMFAGIGVAMGNGDEHIKNNADIITEDCDNYGVANILEKILKGELK